VTILARYLRRAAGIARRYRPALVALLVVLTSAVAMVAIGLAGVYLDRGGVPDLGPFIRFEFPAVGHIYDVHGQPLIELAGEYRDITPYTDIPPVVRTAILAAEDKRFFSHNGVDYLSFPRILTKMRVGGSTARSDSPRGSSTFPQGGSTLTQQLVRGLFLQHETSVENSNLVQSHGVLAGALGFVAGARNVNMLLRKREEMRLALWLEEQMRQQFGSKRRAKEEILARYASFVYMGNRQYGFARASEYYFGRRLSSLTAADADKAALLAAIMKSPRDYAPTAHDPGLVLRRRNQILQLMNDAGAISSAQTVRAVGLPLTTVAPREAEGFQSSAVVQHVLDELAQSHPDLGVDDLLQGRLQIASTVDARVQQIVTTALEHGLAQYDTRHPAWKGLVQGSVVVLRNADASVLAETGGRQLYRGHATEYGDLNRARQSLRQPGSAMKPIVYMAAFHGGGFSLETLVPDQPISVPTGLATPPKWISNYDGQFKGLIPVREALAESRNAVAIWIASQIGIKAVLAMSRELGIQTPLQPYPTTALGASEVNLLELANAYRTIASGRRSTPYVITGITREVAESEVHQAGVGIDDPALALIQEGLRGVVRIPTGTAHALDSNGFPIAVMGKTGTTNNFRDALFLGSTYGVGGITVAVRIGFDDNRSLGAKETGALVALPVFEEIMALVYRSKAIGPAPTFPDDMEQRITQYLVSIASTTSTPSIVPGADTPNRSVELVRRLRPRIRW
jgi:penicillin-binding protein 1A